MEMDFPKNCKCLLSDRPSARFCAVMVFDLDEFECWLCLVGGNKWECHVYTLTMYNAKDQPVERHIARRHGIAALGGRVYFEYTGNELGFIEFDPANPEPKIGFVDVDRADMPDSMPMWSSYLVESCGELFHVVIFFDGENVHKVAEVAVYKMDFSTPAWCKVDGIGDRVFLLGGDRIEHSNFGASCSASQHGLPSNCVYFLNHLAINENWVHVIDLEKGTEEMLRPFKEFVDPLRPPFWMLPTQGVDGLLLDTPKHTKKPEQPPEAQKHRRGRRIMQGISSLLAGWLVRLGIDSASKD
ncbi:hypothetical protein HU200_020364 [Digitaria exilis]|uniref:KIB1-4 beta-propeller domain-containing protein n=1 Tax=Digitaria exilis TaxID=1010633 RepID=A0A835F1X0_9POAL|nr:hypothetical protein HU200_020364 [Digitaria exilis]